MKRAATFSELILFGAVLLALPLWGYAPIQVGNRGIRLDWILVWLLIGINLALLLSYRRKLYREPSLVGVVFFNITILFSIAYPLSNGGSHLVDYVTTYVQFQTGLLLFYVMTQVVVSHAHLRVLVKIYLFVGVFVASFGVIQFFASMTGLDLTLEFRNPSRVDPHSGYTEALLGFRRSTSFFSEPRQFGGFLVTRLCLVIALLFYGGSRVMSRKTLIGGGAILAAGVISSLSASALVATALGIALTILLPGLLGRVAPLSSEGKILARIRSFGWIVLVLFSGAVLLFVVDPAGDWLVRRLEQLTDMASLGRAFASPEAGTHGALAYVTGAGYAVSVLGEHLVTGVGLNNLQYFRPAWISGAHGLFGFAAEVGLVGVGGLVIFVSSFAIALRRSWSASGHRRSRMGWCGLAAATLFVVPFVTSFATGLYGLSSTFFWVDCSFACLLLSSLGYSRQYQSKHTHTGTSQESNLSYCI